MRPGLGSTLLTDDFSDSSIWDLAASDEASANIEDNRLTCQTWSSPQAAADWATRVLGEREQRTCENCTKTQTTPGVGLTPMIQEEYETKLQARRLW